MVLRSQCTLAVISAARVMPVIMATREGLVKKTETAKGLLALSLGVATLLLAPAATLFYSF